MSALIDPEEIAHESELVWLEDAALDYVRQSLETAAFAPRQARLPPRRPHGRLRRPRQDRQALPSGTFRRRVFWLLPHDRDQQPDGLYSTGAPSEAVDSRTIEPRVKCYKTERSEGGPASPAMIEAGVVLPRS